VKQLIASAEQKYFSTLDTDRGFWQVGIAEEEKLKFKG